MSEELGNEEWVDWHALHSGGNGWAEDFYREMGEECSEDVRAAVQDVLGRLLRWIFQMRLADPKALDVFAVRFLNPDLTHEQVAKLLHSAGRVGLGSRSSACEAWRRLVDRHPELGDSGLLDARGGWRPRKRLAERIADEYLHRVAANAAVEPAKRLPMYGPYGFYASMAEKFGVVGVGGVKSPGAVQSMVAREMKKRCRCQG